MVGQNAIQIELEFNNTKSAVGEFRNEKGQAISFNTKPAIQLTLDSTASAPPYTASINETGNLYTGVTVKFQTYYIGKVFVLITEV